jgi:hypothetical protein
VVFCPVCKADWEAGISECPICGRRLEFDETEAAWLPLGVIADKISADFAREVLKSYEIPSVVISKSGFFGQVGLPLNPIYSADSALFEISVPANCAEEAAVVLDMALGDKWQRKEEDS